MNLFWTDDPHVRQHSFVEFVHEIISTAILSLPLIQEVQSFRRAMNVRKMNNQTNEILNIHKLYTLRLSMQNLFSNE